VPEVRRGLSTGTLSQWVDTHGLEVAVPPREVYFADFGEVEPSDDACDVAIPVRR
jgi:effector-binding domain-containing protein